jgi:hypothetical protein
MLQRTPELRYNCDVWSHPYVVDETLECAERWWEKCQAVLTGDTTPQQASDLLDQAVEGLMNEWLIEDQRDPYLRTGSISWLHLQRIGDARFEQPNTEPICATIYDCAGYLCLEARRSGINQSTTFYGVSLIATPNTHPADLHETYSEAVCANTAVIPYNILRWVFDHKV